MPEAVEEIAKKRRSKKRNQKMFKILPYITQSKPTSTNLLKVNRRAKRTTRSS